MTPLALWAAQIYRQHLERKIMEQQVMPKNPPSPTVYAPIHFARELEKYSKNNLVDLLWSLMVQSPWFDEKRAHEDPFSVADKVAEEYLNIYGKPPRKRG